MLEPCALLSGLRQLLPTDFSDLEVPLAVGVYEVGAERTPLLVDSGDLVEAVVASCAVRGPGHRGGPHARADLPPGGAEAAAASFHSQRSSSIDA